MFLTARFVIGEYSMDRSYLSSWCVFPDIQGFFRDWQYNSSKIMCEIINICQLFIIIIIIIILFIFKLQRKLSYKKAFSVCTFYVLSHLAQLDRH